MEKGSFIIGDSNIFEERAEYLSREELKQWTVTSHKDKHILGKLKGVGSKLLFGPRGCGKSTYLRRSYFELLDERQVLPIYVNYSRSMALEPLFSDRVNALLIFRQWLLHKILNGLSVTLDELGINPHSNVCIWLTNSTERLHDLQSGLIVDDELLSIDKLQSILKIQADACGLKRIVLLLDDAAHVFSAEQQREFFEVFRQLRSRDLSPKAAVYPGVTSYSKGFQVGHEAELVQAWYEPEGEQYLEMMKSMIDLRFPEELKSLITGHDDVVSFLAFASFGIPRGFLNMLSQIIGADSEMPNRPTRSLAITSVKDYAESVRQVYLALSKKIPRFKNFIEIGAELESSVIKSIQEFNRHKNNNAKALYIAIKEPISNEISKVLQFLEYAGIFRRMESLSKGEKGTFQRFSVHYAFLISSNSLSLGKSYSLTSVVDIFSNVDKHAYVRRSVASLLNDNIERRCVLDMLACTKCGTERISEEQRFCANCGSQLSNASIYRELLGASIEVLPLTLNKIEGILAHTELRTVQDIINDESNLREIPQVGPYWQAKIKTCAEEFISV